MNLQRIKQLAGIKLTESVSAVPAIGESVNDELRRILMKNPEIQGLKAKAQENSKKGYVQHVNVDQQNNRAYISDWFDTDETIASYEGGSPVGVSAHDMAENTSTAMPNTQGAPMGSAGHNAAYAGFDAAQGPATEGINDGPDTDCILHHLTSAWTTISQNMRDSVSSDGLRTIEFIYHHLREPLMKGDLAGFEKAWEYCGAQHVDAFDFFVDEVFAKAGLGDHGTYEQFVDSCKESSLEEKAPPGEEKLVKSLKKEYPGHEDKAFATAWSIYNKKHGKSEGVEEEAQVVSCNQDNPENCRTACAMEEEIVTEISKEMRDRYVNKAVDQHGHAAFGSRHATGDDQKEFATLAKKRASGISAALNDKRTGKTAMNEEISKDAVEHAIQRLTQLSDNFISVEEAVEVVTNELEGMGYSREEIGEIMQTVDAQLYDNDTDMGPDDMQPDADALASAGHGSDEDYGGSEEHDFPMDETSAQIGAEGAGHKSAIHKLKTLIHRSGVRDGEIAAETGNMNAGNMEAALELWHVYQNAHPELMGDEGAVSDEMSQAYELGFAEGAGQMNENFNLNNGYDDIEYANGKDYFPDGADSPVVDATGPSGARQGDNPEQKKMEVTETHKELVYSYRAFLKESARK